jgi:hypothetical protein
VAVKDDSPLRCGTVDPHRSYPDDSDGRWYQAERGYPDQDWERRAGDEARLRPGPDPRYAEDSPYAAPARGEPDRYTVPEQRSGAHGYDSGRYADLSVPEPATGLPGRATVIGPRSGEPLPPLPADLATDLPRGTPGGEAPRHETESTDRTAPRRPGGGVQRLGDGVYRARRPALAALLIVLTVVLEVPAIRLLAASFQRIEVNGTVSGTLLVIALPMFAIGLYALASGAAVAPGQAVRVWLRIPLAYLPLGLVLLVAAALAA